MSFLGWFSYFISSFSFTRPGQRTNARAGYAARPGQSTTSRRRSAARPGQSTTKFDVSRPGSSALVVHRGTFAVVASGTIALQGVIASPGRRLARSDAAALCAIDTGAPIDPRAGSGSANVVASGGVVVVAVGVVGDRRVNTRRNTA